MQDILNDRTSERKTDGQLEYLLGGLLYCKDCGRSIRISKDVLKKSIGIILNVIYILEKENLVYAHLIE